MADFRPTNELEGDSLAQEIEDLKASVERMRRSWDRRWYDNNFFDDGYHFRYVHRTTDQIIDTTRSDKILGPKRAIPKASRQIRGIANLLMSFNYHPVVYPRKVDKSKFNPSIRDPQSGQVLHDPQYQMAIKQANDEARKKGLWIADEWDRLGILENHLPWMILLAEKNSVSFMEFFYDEVKESNEVEVYDAFDTYLKGNLKDIQDSPFLGFTLPTSLREIMANEKYNEEARNRVISDNKLAESMAKEAYEASKYGMVHSIDSSPTAIIKKFYLKETLNETNLERIINQKNAMRILRGKSKGDDVIRQVYCAHGVNLYDKYLPLDEYPAVDFRMEPGQIWQTPQIERFIDTNKSLDLLVSRIERFINTMTVGMWIKKAGEQFQISNAAGGMVVKYKGTRPQQADLTPLPNHVFEFINLLESLIEEQGVTTTTLGKIPAGVKANAAIESLKASEFANLTINIAQIRKTVQRIAEMQIKLAANNYIKPKEVEVMEKGDSESFEIIGQSGVDAYESAQAEVPGNPLIIGDDTRVRVEVESGPGFTVQAKRDNALKFAEFLSNAINSGAIQHPTMRAGIEKVIETWQFGSLSEYFEEEEPQGLQPGVRDEIKTAVLEVIRDLQNAQSGKTNTPPGEPSVQSQPSEIPTPGL